VSDGGGVSRAERAALDAIDAVCDRFEAAWASGEAPRIDDYLTEAKRANSPPVRDLLVELVMIDMEHRWRGAAQRTEDAASSASTSTTTRTPVPRDAAGPDDTQEQVRPTSSDQLPLRPTLEDYLTCYPALGPGNELPESLVAAERRIRTQWGRSGGTRTPPVCESLTLPGVFPDTQRLSVQRRIGDGGMGVVYQAYDRQRNEVVAVKTLRQLDPATLYRLKREFRTLADLSHPNLARLYDLFSVEGWCFFSMEFVDGVHFLSFVRSDVPCGLAEQPAPPTPQGMARLRAALRQLVEGVLALHQAGKLHRDIKPSNVLVTPQGRVVLLDFGLATELEGETTTDGHIVGTVAYMSPEQAAAEPLTAASDWYSVGVMLYEALIGRPPFQGRHLDVLMEKRQTDPPPPGDLAADVPEDLSALAMALLDRDPKSRPSGEEILRRLGMEPADPRAPQSSPRAPLVGREAELAALDDALAAVRWGRTVVVYVHGESGVGKTALVQRYLSRVREDSGTVTLAGRCYEHESVPYKGFDSLVDALSHYLVGLSELEADALMPRDVVALAQVFPVLQRVDAIAQAPLRTFAAPDQQEQRDRAFRALRELLVRLGDRKTLVLSIDDLQWGDLDSIALLHDLLRPPDPPVLLLVVCYRSEEEAASPVLRSLFQLEKDSLRQTEIRRVRLAPLDDADARRLAQNFLGAEGAPSTGLCEAIAQESGGNPYLLGVLARHRQRRAPDAKAKPAPGAIRLEDVLWDEISQLPEAPRRLLEVVAVAGHPLRDRDAFLAAGLVAEGPEALDILRHARMIRTTWADSECQIEAYHDRVRETVAARLAADTLVTCHGRLAEVLEASGGETATLASHFAAAGQLRRAGACYAQAAAQAAQSLAFDRAAHLYRIAEELLSPEESAHRGLKRGLADALANAGRGAEAAREYLAAATAADPAEGLDLRRRAATQFLTSGHLDEGLAALQAVLETVGMRLPGPARAVASLLLRRALLRLRGVWFRTREAQQVPKDLLVQIDICWSATVGLSLVDPLRGADFHTRCLLLALRSGEPFLVARSLSMEAAHLAAAGGRTERRVQRLLDRAKALAGTANHPYLSAVLSLTAATCAFLQGRWQRAIDGCQQAEILFRDHCTGVVWELDTAKGFCLAALSHSGQVARLAERLPRAIDEARKRGDLYSLAHNATLVLAALAEDDPDRAEQEIRRWHQEGSDVQPADELCAMVDIDLYRNRFDAAWQRVQRQWPRVKRSCLPHVQLLRGLAWYARARSALAAAEADAPADAERLLRVARGDARRLAKERQPWLEPLSEVILAGVAAFRGERARAASLLAQAAAHFEAVDMPLHAMSATRRLGELQGREEGQALIARADAWMMDQGIRNPARMAAVFAPGVVPRAPSSSMA